METDVEFIRMGDTGTQIIYTLCLCLERYRKTSNWLTSIFLLRHHATIRQRVFTSQDNVRLGGSTPTNILYQNKDYDISSVFYDPEDRGVSGRW